jgi:hypothetical protein
MIQPFDQLQMPKELACEFLGVFSRFEYALKSTSYANGGTGSVSANWDGFGRSIDEAFGRDVNQETADAISYLLEHPPRKQVLLKKRVEFIACPPNIHGTQAIQVLLMVRRVRNNLFHGGKYLPDGETEVGRNRLLVKCSLTVLEYCLGLDPNVQASYER